MVSTAHLTDPMTRPPRVSRDCGRAVIWLDGEHDIATVAVVADVLARVTAADDGDVMVDLSGATFFDAATVSSLVHARNLLILGSRHLTLRSPRSFQQRVLGVCGLSGLVERFRNDDPPSTPPSSSGRIGS